MAVKIIIEEDIDKIEMAYDGVLIETKKNNLGLTTEGGVIVGVNIDTQYRGEGSHPADLAINSGTVVKIPKRLNYRKGDPNTPWDTLIEIWPGDKVWFSYFDGYNADIIQSGDRFFRVIDYRSLYVAVRGDRIIPLNGYLFVEPDKLPVKSGDIYLVNEKAINTKWGTVRYVGNPVREYAIDLSDDLVVFPGDRVMLRRSAAENPVFLERARYNSTFPDGTALMRIQRKDIELVYRKK